MNLDLDDIRPEAEAIARRIEREMAPGRSARELLESIPEARNLVLAAVFRCLGARKWYFKKGQTEKVFEDDSKTQLDAARLLLAYGDGLPMQTTLAVNVGDPAAAGAASLEEAVDRSPALRDRLARLASAKPNSQRLTKVQALSAGGDGKSSATK